VKPPNEGDEETNGGEPETSDVRPDEAACSNFTRLATLLILQSGLALGQELNAGNS